MKKLSRIPILILSGVGAVIGLSVVSILLFLTVLDPKAGKGDETSPTSVGKRATTRLGRIIDLLRVDGEIKSDWKTPINFYGKVIDENGVPVEGAEVEFGYTDLSESGHSTRSTRSNKNGLFSLEGTTGKHLSVKIFHDEYHNEYADSSDSPTSFFYSGANVPFVPDKNNPIVYKMRRKLEPVPLVVLQKTKRVPGFGLEFALPRDGTETLISLTGKNLKSTLSEEIVLKVEFLVEDKKQFGAHRFNWKYRLAVLGGEMLEAKSGFDFLAPTSGYHESIEIDMPASLGEDWHQDLKKHYFFRTESGHYGRMTVDYYPFYGNSIRIESYINPSGSRLLEYDKELNNEYAR